MYKRFSPGDKVEQNKFTASIEKIEGVVTFFWPPEVKTGRITKIERIYKKGIRYYVSPDFPGYGEAWIETRFLEKVKE